MAKTLAQIQAQIDKLKVQREALLAKDMAGVVAKIKSAIAHYGLTAEDLGLGAKRVPTPGARVAVQAPAAKGIVQKKAGAAASKPAGKKPAGVIKFGDAAGNQWTGNGQRPGWFKAALAAGKTADDLRVKPAA